MLQLRQPLTTLLIATLAVASVSADLCRFTSFGKTYDINMLNKYNPKADITDNYIVQERGSGGDDYDYVLNLCSPINGADSIGKDRGNTGIFQKIVGQPSSDGFVVGTTTDFQLISLHDGDLRAVFGKGDASTRTNNTRQGTVVLNCEDVGLGQPVYIGELSYLTYVFVWNTCAACPVGSDIRNNCPAVTNLCTKAGLSPGSVILITFFTLLAAYLIFGVVIMRMFCGAHGCDQLPHREFWGGVWGDIKAGFAFTFRRKATISKVSYQGMDNNTNFDEELDSEDPDADEI